MTTAERWTMALNLHHVIDRVMSQYGVREPADRDDVKQEALAWLYRRAPEWNPTRGSWAAFGHLEVRHAIRAFRIMLVPFGHSHDMPSARTRERIENNNQDRPVVDLVGDLRPASEYVATASMQRAMATLGERERDVLALRTGDQTCSDIGRDLGISAQRVSQIELAAVAKLRRHLGVQVAA